MTSLINPHSQVDVGNPFFSVVVPVYNKEPHIARSLSSVLKQTFSNFELIVVCDPSTDASNEEVAKFEDPRIRVFYRDEPGPGGYAARNLGIKKARADWIAFLDADDEWSETHLANYEKLIEKYPQAGVLGCGCKIFDPELESQWLYDSFFLKYRRSKSIYLNFKDYLLAEVNGLRPLNATTACVKKKVLEKAGMFPAGKALRGGDVDTWLRCIEEAQGIAWSAHVGGTYYRNSINMVTRSSPYYAQVERNTIGKLLHKYSGEEALLLKRFSNVRTIAAWRHNFFEREEIDFNIYNKLYYAADMKRALTWAGISLVLVFLSNIKSFRKKALARIVCGVKDTSLGAFLRFIKYVFFIVKGQRRRFGKRLDAESVFLSDGKNATFFGYHDKTPFSANGKKILAMSVTADDGRAESECSEIRLGYFEKNNKGEFTSSFIAVATTNTWCWQQGCMLQWHPKKPDNWVVFNCLVNGDYGAQVLDIDTGEAIKTYKDPIYAISGDGKWASTLNFSRLGRLRPGYGYSLLEDHTRSIKAPSDDGVFIFDLETGSKRLLVSLAELAADLDTGEAEHYINHATFSPDGSNLLFFHLWSEVGRPARGLRTCVVNMQTKKWRVLEQNRVVSHYCWRDNSRLFATTKERNGGWHYSLYDALTGAREDLDIPLQEDFHPMFHPQNDRILVIDTYPDKRRDQHLCLIDIDKGIVNEVAVLRSPYRYQGQVRCDLHSRWDRWGQYIVVDTTVSGRRKLGCFKVSLC